MAGSIGIVEVVRGDLSEERAAEIRDFWRACGEPEAESPAVALEQVVCVASDETGEIAAVASATEQEIPLVGRRFWLYRSWSVHADDLADGLFNTAFEVLEEESGSGGGPVGLGMLVADPGRIEREPEAVWPDTRLMFAGYLPDDRQVRIRYFRDATIGPGAEGSPSASEALTRVPPMDERFRIEPLAGSTTVTPEDVLAMWGREGVLPRPLAYRRIHQVSLVATTGDGRVAGVSTLYLSRNAQLRMDAWYYRTFVAAEHRHSDLATHLIVRNRELLERRFTSGEDTRGAAMIFELQNEGLRRHLNMAVWPKSGFTFIGENPQGDHVRIFYFPGATIPPPRAAT
jgi:hypothetical protein